METERAARRRPPWEALALFAAVLLLYLAVRAVLPTPRLWGDEPWYVQLAREDAEAGRWSLLPGALGFDHRPILGVRVASWMVPGVIRGQSLLNAFLIAGVALLVFAQGRLLALSRGASVGAALGLTLFPWFGFHVVSLWPEVLHALLMGLALLCLLAHARRPHPGWLVGGGFATGYALLCKGALNPFVPLLALGVAYASWKGSTEGEPRTCRRRSLGAALLYLGVVLVTIAPQLGANASAGHGAVLAANRWWNLELGLETEATVGEVNERYWNAADTPRERERLAKERVLASLRAVGPLERLRHQARELRLFLFARPSEFEASLHREARWGEEPPGWLLALETPARLWWYALLALGAAGLLVAGRRSPGWTLLAAFTLAYALALCAVPVKPRFAQPLLGPLALFAAAAVEAGVQWLRARTGRSSGDDPQSTTRSAPFR